MTGPGDRLARNEALFREINERIHEAALAHGMDGHVYEFLCECSDSDCLEQVGLTLAEYERVRRHSRRFVVAPGHHDPAVETVVLTDAGHEVVEKHGDAGEVAESLDPRAA